MGDSYTASFQMQRAQIAQFAKEPKTIRDIEQLGYLLNTTVPNLFGTKVDETRLLIAGAGLTGGGDLSGDITFDVGQGTGMIINADDIAIDLVAEAERIRDVMGTALIDTATIDFTADDAADTIKADLKNTTVTPGSYTSASITVDAQGRITAASSGSVAAGSIGPTELASTSVTPGSYTNTNLTVDADGRLTAASNGSAEGAGRMDAPVDRTAATGVYDFRGGRCTRQRSMSRGSATTSFSSSPGGYFGQQRHAMDSSRSEYPPRPRSTVTFAPCPSMRHRWRCPGPTMPSA
jgi:hypothetical protein